MTKSKLSKKNKSDNSSMSINEALFIGLFFQLIMFLFTEYLYDTYFNNLSINKCKCATNITSYNDIQKLIQIKLNIYLIMMALFIFIILIVNISSYTQHLAIQFIIHILPFITFCITIFNIYFTIMLSSFMYDYHNKDCNCSDNLRKTIIIVFLIVEIILLATNIFKLII